MTTPKYWNNNGDDFCPNCLQISMYWNKYRKCLVCSICGDEMYDTEDY